MFQLIERRGLGLNTCQDLSLNCCIYMMSLPYYYKPWLVANLKPSYHSFKLRTIVIFFFAFYEMLKALHTGPLFIIPASFQINKVRIMEIRKV